ncbi:ketopantoate reductase family protein [Neobacillus massiliamazoniensis]|uniref:2-dehydropantoate 2-reductase n=1 Tax=Neobacillus massiliamazoniensis TaxID=1499688 RepID=A0A0U1NT92_9BACI|nr:2-dehydropantoate 2-reductase [Neobacillus massiliamazoniensis]CRK80952.1 2-dehydropantoate 2-reductase [Neobacillus massiliamazoniensis]
MKIGVAGTGAVGGYFGAMLQKAGNEVIFLARGNSLKCMVEKGLIVESEAETFSVEGTFTDRYESLSEVDLLLFCVKSTATKEVATKLQPYLKKECVILCFQNGVDNEEILSAIFGKERVIPVSTYIQTFVKEPGVVKQIGFPPRLVIGALEAELSNKVSDLATLFNDAHIETFTSRNILGVKWKKLLWNVTFNPLTALLEVKVGAIFENEGLKQTAIKICQEAIAVARNTNVDIEEDFFETILEQGELARNHDTSMLQDKRNGKAMELESICGYIVKKGKKLNVETPALETIYHLLKYQEEMMKDPFKV